MRSPFISFGQTALKAARFAFAAAVFTTFAALVPAALQARETVLEDTPSRLVLEISPEDFQAVSTPDGARGSRIVSPEFGSSSQTGAPDVPWLRFQVATGDRMPVVSLEPLEWVEVAVPGGLAGLPRWITNTRSEPSKDAALFAAARGIAPEVSGIQLQRGLKLREIALPIVSYSGGDRASLMKKFRVRVEFSNPSQTPAKGVKTWLLRAGVKNPNGGQYLTALPPAAPLRRVAASSQFDPGAARLKITIGDRELDGMDEDGVYGLTFDRAQAAGLPSGVSVSTLRLYNGPQDTLTFRLDAMVAPTLREIPIEVRDANGNLTFDAGDTILFYAHGTSIWKPVAGAATAVQWEFLNDPWSFENRYYLQWNGAAGARIPTAPSLATADTAAAAPHYLRAGKDVITGSCDLAGYYDDETGFVWSWYRKFHCLYGSAPGFGNTNPVLSWAQLRRPPVDSLPGRASDTVRFGFFLYDRHKTDQFIPWSGADTLPYESQDALGAWYVKTAGFSGNATKLDSVQWNGPYPRFTGYSVRYARNLQWGEGRVIFPAAAGQRVAYKIANAPAGMRVLRVEEGVGARWLALAPVGGASAFSDSAAADANVRYVLYGGSSIPVAPTALALETAPTADGVIQNLRDGSIGGARQNPEYIIIAPTALLPEAVQLRNYRVNSARLTPMATSVVRVEDIYREWSGGRLSPVAIRDFLRWAVNRWGAGNTSGRLQYVVLFGDGHYDYRNLTGTTSPNNIPPFNWLKDDLDGNPMNSDDFYAVVDSGETWTSSNPTLSVGRLPFKTRLQAADYLEKISRYESPASSGEWRSRLLLIGDDQKQRAAIDNAGSHTEQSESLGNAILAQDSGMRAEKLYLFDYPGNATYLKPEATQDLINNYNRGVLFSTFFGHGAYNQMADEVLLKTNDGLSRIRNPGKNFFMTLFSCTVGRFDKLADEGMSEQFLRQKEYGAMGAVSASRETYAHLNSPLGNAFATRAFIPTPDTSVVLVGDALRLAKSIVSFDGSLNRQKYILQGEPVLALNRPGLGIQMDQTPDTLQALGCDSLSGRITRGSGRGAVSVRIVSGDIPKVYPGAHSSTSVAQKRGQILFERTVPYVDSAFSLQYFIPKDVPFGDSTAKIQIFAWDSLQLRESALLVSNLRIAGTAASSCMVNDQRGPRIAVTGCNVREGGQIDFPDKVKIGLPYCLQITVSDTGGGVLSGDGPDQGTTVQVVGSIAPFQPQAGVDELSVKTYQLTLSKQEIADGTHLLKISAQDGFGNVNQRQITLQVAQDTALTFVRAFNVPNPLKRGQTTFWFSTTLPDDEGGALQEPLTDRVRFDVRVFNQAGYMVREFRDARSGETRWDGRDAWGQTLANGVYFYDVTATWSEASGGPPKGRRVSRKNTLVISR